MAQIRPALASDVQWVAPLIFQAMEDIVFKLIGQKNPEQGITFIQKLFVQENNQYSYQNTLVYEADGVCVGSLVSYDGKDLAPLRSPVLELAQQINPAPVSIEDETQSGELYIDTLSVSPNFQGMGIGSELVNFLKSQTSEGQKIGLLVDSQNPQAEKLYNRLEFVYENSVSLSGGIYKHLVWKNIKK